jgi:hypothetical protein
MADCERTVSVYQHVSGDARIVFFRTLIQRQLQDHHDHAVNAGESCMHVQEVNAYSDNVMMRQLIPPHSAVETSCRTNKL